MSFNQNFSQQQQQGGQGQQQGQYGNVNMRPQIQRTGSNSSLSSIQPFPPGATQTQGNMGFNSNHLQQLSDFHGRLPHQQQQGMYPVQQQQGQGSFGSGIGGNGNNINYQNSNSMYGNTQHQPQSTQPTFAQQQQNMARLQQQNQYLQAARSLQSHNQAQQQQQQRPPPHSLSNSMQAAAANHGSFQRPPLPNNPSNQSYPHPNHPPIPMPMQRTLSNQSNGPVHGSVSVSGARQVQGQAQAQTRPRPQMPISGYQPNAPFGMADAATRTNSLAPPMPLTQLNDPSVVRSSPAPTPAELPKPPFAPASSAAPPPPQPPKKKRRKPVNNPAKNDKPAPVVFFTGIDKAAKDESPAAGGSGAVARAPGPAVGYNHGHVQTPAPAPVERRRMGNVDGMRGTMRGEIARLMYAAGDVAEPGLESINYVEDLVVEFISDLCRPNPPIRSYPGAIHVAQPINPAHIRHRLSRANRPSLQKYAQRLDYMIAINEDLDRVQREVDGPTNEDLANTAGKEYLGIGEVAAGGVGAGQGGAGGAAGPGKRGRPRKVDGPGGPAGERRKPGPKKGWKSAPPVEGKKRGPYKKRNREGSGMITPKGET